MTFQNQLKNNISHKCISWARENKTTLIVIFMIGLTIYFQQATENKYRTCMNQATIEATKSIEYANETKRYDRFLTYYDDAFGECIKDNGDSDQDYGVPGF